MTTSVLPLSAFLKLRSLFCFKMFNDLRSLRDKFGFDMVIFISVISCFNLFHVGL